MKKIILLIVCLVFCVASYAQSVSVNVHIYGGNERLYFAHPHSWMISHGYYYHNRGYYVHRSGKRIQPNRREAYHRKSNNGHHYGQYKMKDRGHGHGNGHKQGKGHR